MTSAVRVERPSWPRLVGMQFMLILRSGRWVEIVGGLVVLLAATRLFGPPLLVEKTPSGQTLNVPNGSYAGWMFAWGYIVVAFATIWPTLLWRGESPRHRGNHWSLPAPRGSHDLARVMAGVSFVALATAAIAIGRIFPAKEAAKRLGTPGDILSILGPVLPHAATYGLGLLVVYLLASIPALVTAKPARWFYASFLLCWGIAVMMPGRRLSSAWDDVFAGRYGFIRATFGYDGDGVTSGSITVSRTISYPTPAAAAVAKTRDTTKVDADSAFRPGRDGAMNAVYEGLTVTVFNPSGAAAAVWLVVSIGALLMISRARHER